MTNVRVPFNKSNASDTAVLLLAEAEKTDEGAAAVRTVTGAFLVDEEIAKSAGVEYEDPSDEAPEEAPAEESEPTKKAAKKTAAKKTAKTAASKE